MTYKRTVITDDITDVMIHPEPVFDRLKELWQKCLAGEEAGSGWDSVKQCAACGGKDIYGYFDVWGHTYDRCGTCASVFLNPQPSQSRYQTAFYDSPVSAFINSPAFQDQYRSRFEKAIRPLLSDVIQTSKNLSMRVLEVLGRNLHVLNYLNDQQKVREYFRFGATLRDETNQSISVSGLHEIEDNSCDLILLLMSIEHLYSPHEMLPVLSRKLSSEGYMLILARLGSGIDVQVLRGNNPYILPLEHMYLFSVEGFEHLCEKSSLEILELSTPGLLDIQYLQKYYEKHPGENDFFQYFFVHRSLEDRRRFQHFIQEARLSSALKLICKRK